VPVLTERLPGGYYPSWTIRRFGMEWTTDLAVGIESIDSQHRELFRRIGNLLQAIREHRCKAEIDGTIKFLDEYAVFHFGEEERRMAEAGYPELEEHKKHHAVYLRNIGELKDQAALPRVQGMSYELSVTVNQIIVDWIVDHIMKIDKKFGEYVRSRNKE
jgi:hemerythrin